MEGPPFTRVVLTDLMDCVFREVALLRFAVAVAVVVVAQIIVASFLIVVMVLLWRVS